MLRLRVIGCSCKRITPNPPPMGYDVFPAFFGMTLPWFWVRLSPGWNVHGDFLNMYLGIIGSGNRGAYRFRASEPFPNLRSKEFSVRTTHSGIDSPPTRWGRDEHTPAPSVGTDLQAFMNGSRRRPVTSFRERHRGGERRHRFANAGEGPDAAKSSHFHSLYLLFISCHTDHHPRIGTNRSSELSSDEATRKRPAARPLERPQSHRAKPPTPFHHLPRRVACLCFMLSQPRVGPIGTDDLAPFVFICI